MAEIGKPLRRIVVIPEDVPESEPVKEPVREPEKEPA
jgi:hypothetical protein